MSSKNESETVGETLHRSPDGPAVGPDGDDTVCDDNLGRRRFVKGLGASVAAAAFMGHPNGPVQNSEAVAPLIAAGYVGAIGASAALGWASREFEIIGSDPPAQGITADALRLSAYKTARTRKSTNGSTFVDNATIINQSEQPAFTEAKKRAIEGINNGLTESEVLDAAKTEVDAYYTTIQKNLLKSWNETIAEFYNIVNALNDHPDLSEQDVLSSGIKHRDQNADYKKFLPKETRSVNLYDGSSFQLSSLRIQTEYNSSTGNDYQYPHGSDPFNRELTGSAVNNGTVDVVVSHPDASLDDPITYIVIQSWLDAVNNMDTARSNVKTSVDTWVANAYPAVESGDIETSELITPADRASMLSDQGGNALAIADLAALNIPTDVGRRVTLNFGETGTTLRGFMSLTDNTDGPINVGEVYNPENFSGDIYFTTDVSLLEGTWDAYVGSLEGSDVVLTSEPYADTVYDVSTDSGETVSVSGENFTRDVNEWRYNASGELADGANVTDVSYRADSETTNMKTLRLSSPFSVEAIENLESGESADSLTFESAAPQTDDNYVTAEEWNELEKQNKELIDKYEKSQNNGGGVNLGQFDMFGVPGEIVALAAAAVAFLFASR